MAGSAAAATLSREGICSTGKSSACSVFIASLYCFSTSKCSNASSVIRSSSNLRTTNMSREKPSRSNSRRESLCSYACLSSSFSDFIKANMFLQGARKVNYYRTMRLLLGTNNRGKVIEITEVLRDLPLEILTLRDLKITSAPEETGASYEENALLKARFFHGASNQTPTIADDSGIVVEALAGELGMHTRRRGAGPEAT